MAKKILMVDDEADLVSMVTYRLKAAGFETLDALSGEAALALVKTSTPDMILLDIMMPGLDGFEVATQLRADAATRNIPIIFFTAAVGADVARRIAKFKGVGTITKPFDPNLLIEKIHKVLG